MSQQIYFLNGPNANLYGLDKTALTAAKVLSASASAVNVAPNRMA